MSETKRSSGAPKGGRRKKTKTEPAEEAMMNPPTDTEVESSSEPLVESSADLAVDVAKHQTSEGEIPEETSETRAPQTGSRNEEYRAASSHELDEEDERLVREARLERQERDPKPHGKYGDRPERNDRSVDRSADRSDRSADRTNRPERNDHSDRPAREGRNENPAGRRESGGEPKIRPCDEYSLNVHYDKAGRIYQAGFAEFPEIKASGGQKEAVIRDIESRLENHLQNLRRDGKTVPESLHSRRYPERLEVRLSQNLYRRLDVQSRQDKVGLDQLVTELLTLALDKKTEPSRGHERHSQPRHGGGNQRERGGQQQQHSQHRRHGGGRNYQETMENRENFMEYVRNLEKGNLKKR
jgi:predicted HicB family RNase H-like nuclease